MVRGRGELCSLLSCSHLPFSGIPPPPAFCYAQAMWEHRHRSAIQEHICLCQKVPILLTISPQCLQKRLPMQLYYALSRSPLCLPSVMSHSQSNWLCSAVTSLQSPGNPWLARMTKVLDSRGTASSLTTGFVCPHSILSCSKTRFATHCHDTIPSTTYPHIFRKNIAAVTRKVVRRTEAIAKKGSNTPPCVAWLWAPTSPRHQDQ